MKLVGNYNKIPDALKVAPLKKGQTVVYRLLNPVIDPTDPKKQKLIWPKAVKIRTLDTIANPTTREPIDIGVVDKVDKDGMPTIKTFWVRGMENNGYFSVIGGFMNDDQFYEFLELTNANLSNKNRDESVNPQFERIDRVADAKKALKKMDAELDALIYVRDMDVKGLQLLAASMNWDDKDDPDVLRSKAKDFAKEDPKRFSVIVRSKDVEIKAILKRASDQGIINYNIQQNKVVWVSNNETIASLPRVEGQDWLSAMSDWIKTAKNGTTTYDAIKKLSTKEVEKTA